MTAAIKPRWVLTSLLGALSLAGCATSALTTGNVLPDRAATTMPALAPSAAATQQAGLAIDRWWTVFDDASLTRLIDEALARNEDREEALARVRESRATFDAARATLWPTLELQADSGRAQQSALGATPIPPGLDRRASSHGVSLAASYEIDLWGKLSSSTSAARSQLLATEWARAAVEWSLTARVAEDYFGLIAVDRQVVISEAVRDGRAATLQLRQREYAAGAGNEFELRRAEAELTGTEATLAGLARQRAAFERSLLLLLGRNPIEIAQGQLPRDVLDESKPVTMVLPQGAAATLLVRRPDVRQAEAQLAAANANIDAARAATLPALRLSGALGSDTRSISNLFSGSAFVWSMAIGATQSIFDGGRLDARVREEHARAEQSLAGYRKVIASAVLDLREAYTTLDITQHAYRAERDRVASLSRARDIAKAGLDAGALSHIDLLDAERNWYQAQLQHVDTHRDRLLAQVAAFRALGGGYAAGPLQPHVAQ